AILRTAPALHPMRESLGPMPALQPRYRVPARTSSFRRAACRTGAMARLSPPRLSRFRGRFLVPGRAIATLRHVRHCVQHSERLGLRSIGQYLHGQNEIRLEADGFLRTINNLCWIALRAVLTYARRQTRC